VRLLYHFEGSSVLSPYAQERLRVLCGSRVSGGTLAIVAKEYRSLEDNRRAARERLMNFIEEARKIPKKRRATKPTRSSKERRLKEKSVHSEKKRGRSGGGIDA
jgi:ribosome-associated protein